MSKAPAKSLDLRSRDDRPTAGSRFCDKRTDGDRSVVLIPHFRRSTYDMFDYDVAVL
jgi:hypothetical protein